MRFRSFPVVVRLICCLFCVLRAFRQTPIDLSGYWRSAPFSNNFGQKTKATFKIIQKGESVMLFQNNPGMPKQLGFEGHFDGASRVTGRTPGPNASKDNPDWRPDEFKVVDATHIAYRGVAITKIGSLAETGLEQGLAADSKVKPDLPWKPFDLNGDWQSTLGKGLLYRTKIVQKDGELTIFSYGAGRGFLPCALCQESQDNRQGHSVQFPDE
jgi:hypothetical protein